MADGYRIPIMDGPDIVLPASGGGSSGGSGLPLFTLSANVAISADAFDKGIKDMSDKMSGLATSAETAFSGLDGIGDKLGTVFTKVASFAGSALSAVQNVAVAAWNIGTSLIEPAVAYQQRQRTYAMAFSGMEDEAAEKMKALVAYTGYYEGVLQGTFARFQTQFVSAGYTQAEAIEMSTEAMKIAADAAAVYGISLDDATYKVMSFMRGNSEAGETIGLFSAAQTRESYASDMYDQGWKNLTEAQREAVLLKIAQDTYQRGGQSGKATQYSDSFLVAQANLKQIWADVLGKLGTPILEAVSPVLSDLADTLDTPEMQESLKSLASAIGDFLRNLADAFVELLDAVREDPTIVTDFFAMLTDLFNALAELAKIAMPIVQWLIDVIGGPDLEYATVDETAWADDDKLRAALKIMQAADKIGDYSKEHPGSILADDITAFTEAQQAFLKAGGTAEELKTLIGYINQFGVAGYMVSYSGDPGGTGFFDYTPGVGYTKSGQRGNEWATTDPGEIPAGFYNYMMEEFGIPGERFDTLRQDLEGALSSSVGELGSAFTGALSSLPGAMAAGLSGVTVQMDGVVVGHLVAPTVMANMARDVNFRRNTTKST